MRRELFLALGSALMGGCLGAVLAAGAAGQDFHPAPWFWPVVGICGALGLILVGGYSVEAVLSRPRLVIGNPAVELRGIRREDRLGSDQPMMSTTTTATSLSVTEIAITGVGPTTHIDPGEESLYGAYVRITNRPRFAGRDAENVVTHLRFLASDGKITEIHGRWSQTKQHGDPERTLEPVEMTIPSNKRPRWLDVAIKYLDDDVCHAFNDESRFHRPTDLRYRPLGASPIEVEVTATGSNCRPVKAKFILSHGGKGSIPSFKAAATKSLRQ
jgi:hypothetical protein